jgi:hypothetical protein
VGSAARLRPTSSAPAPPSSPPLKRSCPVLDEGLELPDGSLKHRACSPVTRDQTCRAPLASQLATWGTAAAAPPPTRLRLVTGALSCCTYCAPAPQGGVAINM